MFYGFDQKYVFILHLKKTFQFTTSTFIWFFMGFFRLLIIIVGRQYCISFRYTIYWFNVYISYVITTIHLVSICHCAKLSNRYCLYSPVSFSSISLLPPLCGNHQLVLCFYESVFFFVFFCCSDFFNSTCKWNYAVCVSELFHLVVYTGGSSMLLHSFYCWINIAEYNSSFESLICLIWVLVHQLSFCL